MRELLYSSARRFQMWLYSPSHSQLLLRSNKSETERTRIDLLFKGVDALNLNSLLDGVRVEKDESKDEASVAVKFGKTLYRLSGVEFNGFVVASSFSHMTDEGEYFEPSSFEASLGRAL
jgi:hypothetical protein